MRIALAGKGGLGKSVIAGTLARLAARRGAQVLALDSDPMPGLSWSLGCHPDPDPPPLVLAARQDAGGGWGWADGVDAITAVERFATAAPDGVRLLQRGKLGAAGTRPLVGANKAFWEVVHALAGTTAFRERTLIGDLAAGPQQPAEGWAPYAETLLVVVTPSAASVATARRIVRLAPSGARVALVANRLEGAAQAALLERSLESSLLATIPADPAVQAAEAIGRAPLDHDPEAPAIRAIAALLDRLDP